MAACSVRNGFVTLNEVKDLSLRADATAENDSCVRMTPLALVDGRVCG